MRHWIGAIALAIAPTLVVPADAAVYRIQSRPMTTLVGRGVPAPDLTPDPPRLVVPTWMDWALRLMDGRAFTFARPRWEGRVAAWRWRVGLEAGLKGRMDLGYGPAVVLSGHLGGRSWAMDSQTTALANTQGSLSWLSEVTLGRAPWSLNLRAWDGPGSSSVGRSATLSLRRGF